jgi:hypothetical protein
VCIYISQSRRFLVLSNVILHHFYSFLERHATYKLIINLGSVRALPLPSGYVVYSCHKLSWQPNDERGEGSDGRRFLYESARKH